MGEKKKLSKKAKGWLIAGIAVSALALFYVAPGIIAGNIVFDHLFANRLSNKEDLDGPLYDAVAAQRDFPELSLREEVSFPSGKYQLSGYVYKPVSPKGLILSCHGMGGQADSNESVLIPHFLAKDYAVFSFDLTASGSSEGKGWDKGLRQGTHDVKSAENYIKSRTDLSSLPLALVGHSVGAYGVMTSISYDQTPFAVIAFSGYDTPNTFMIHSAAKTVGDWAYATVPTFDLVDLARYGTDSFISASDVIKSHPKTPYFLIHGTKDETVDYKKSSAAYQVQKMNLPNAELYIREGIAHAAPWLSQEAHDAYYEGMKKTKAYQKGKLTEEEFSAFALENKPKTKELDPSLFLAVDAFLDNHFPN